MSVTGAGIARAIRTARCVLVCWCCCVNELIVQKGVLAVGVASIVLSFFSVTGIVFSFFSIVIGYYSNTTLALPGLSFSSTSVRSNARCRHHQIHAWRDADRRLEAQGHLVAVAVYRHDLCADRLCGA